MYEKKIWFHYILPQVYYTLYIFCFIISFSAAYSVVWISFRKQIYKGNNSVFYMPPSVLELTAFLISFVYERTNDHTNNKAILLTANYELHFNIIIPRRKMITNYCKSIRDRFLWSGNFGRMSLIFLGRLMATIVLFLPPTLVLHPQSEHILKYKHQFAI